MSRKTKDVTIDMEGRDKGKLFRITEMAAFDSESWANRALFAIGSQNPELPDDLQGSGLAGIAAVGIKAFATIPWETAKPLLDEMLACVQIVPDPKQPKVVRDLIVDDVEEVATLLFLRSEVISLHTNFSLAAALSSWAVAFRRILGGSSDTPTSPKELAH